MKLNDELIEYCKRDVEITMALKRHMELKEECERLYEVFTELTKAGFTETQAFMVMGIFINK